LALSRIDPKKGLDLFLKAFAQIKAEGQLKDWRLVIAGDGKRAYVEQLQQLVRGTAAEPFVEWPGWLAGDVKFAALQEASLFVLSSHQENFAIGVLEAMACGTPVLISHRVGLASAVAEAKAGWIVSLDVAGLCRGLVEATRNPSELQARGAAARKLVAERFTWPRIAADWVTHYNTIVAQSPKPSLAYA
jgi:glycosyltransferase involved in cell wall biosynthesis